MEPIDSLKKIPLKDIAQTPIAYALYVIVLVLVSVIIGQQVSIGSSKSDCQTTISRLEKDIKVERQIKDEVFKAYLVERQTNKAIQQTVDSTVIENYKTIKK